MDNIYLDRSYEFFYKLFSNLLFKSFKIALIFYEGYPLDNIGTVTYFVDVMQTRNVKERKKIN